MDVNDLDDFLCILINFLVTITAVLPLFFLDFVVASLFGHCVLLIANHELEILVGLGCDLSFFVLVAWSICVSGQRISTKRYGLWIILILFH